MLSIRTSDEELSQEIIENKNTILVAEVCLLVSPSPFCSYLFFKRLMNVMDA